MAASPLAQDKDVVDQRNEVPKLPRRECHPRLLPLPEGPACVLAIGTAFPAAVINQSTYHDDLFEMCGISDSEPQLKAEFKRLCDSWCVDKRHTFVTPDLIAKHPELATYSDNSLTTRVSIANNVIPELAVEAARNAVREWGRPLSAITHTVLATTSATSIPGIDIVIARSLALAPTVQRVCMYQTAFWGGAAAVRIGRLLAESAQHARVLVIAVEANTVMNFRKPVQETLTTVDHFMAHGILGDGAAALILGCDPLPSPERPLFEIYWSAQRVVPNSETAIHGNLSESGQVQYVQKDTLPKLIATNLEELTSAARAMIPGGAPSHADMFWVVHPGANVILDVVEKTLGLDREQLQPSWDVLRSYGNCASPTSLLVLDEMRRRSARVGAATTGAGCEWGLLVGFGPGFTLEASLLRSVPLELATINAQSIGSALPLPLSLSLQG